MLLFFFKQKTAYEMRISDWSSDVCSSDLSASASSTATSSGDARRSSLQPDASPGGRQGADALDERVECGLGGVLVAKEPAPDPLDFAIQQREETHPLRSGHRLPFLDEPADQHVASVDQLPTTPPPHPHKPG